MATSGSYNFSLTAAQLISAAYEDLGVIKAGATVPSALSTLALSRLNMVSKQHQGMIDGAPGLKIHTRQRVALFLAKGQQQYRIGPSSVDARATTQYGRTTLSAAEAAGQTVLSITSNTDTTNYPGTTVTMTSGDIIGIKLDDGTIQWTTISGTPGATATVSVALTGNAGSGSYVYWFTARAQRFPFVESAVLRNSSMNDIELGVYSNTREYDMGVVDKYADGQPSTILIEPLTTSTQITLNSQPTDVTEQIILTVLYPAEDYDATTDDIAFPQEAYRFLSWELAFALSPSIGRWTKEMEMNRQESRLMYYNLNPENSSLYFMSAT